MIAKYKQALENLKGEYQSLLGEKQILQNKVKQITAEISVSQKQQEKNNNISSTLQRAAEMSRSTTKGHLEKVVTSALRYVFDKDYEFEIEITESRGVASAEFYVKYIEGKNEIKVKPQDATGGGVIDIISTALRFAFLELLGDPNIQGTIVLDEPAKMVSEMASVKMAELLKELNKSFSRQVIMCTHNEIYATSADMELLVTQNGAYSNVNINIPNNKSVIEEDINVKEENIN